METDRQNCNTKGHGTCQDKYPERNVCPVGKVIQPFIHRPDCEWDRDSYCQKDEFIPERYEIDGN